MQLKNRSFLTAGLLEVMVYFIVDVALNLMKEYLTPFYSGVKSSLVLELDFDLQESGSKLGLIRE